MIRNYKSGDELGDQFNEFSNVGEAISVFGDPSCHKFTVEVSNEVKSIVCWKELEVGNFAAFLIMANNIGLAECRELKRSIYQAISDFKPKRLFTYSQNCDTLNRWHEFLGFKIEEGSGLIVNGKNFNKWVMSWE